MPLKNSVQFVFIFSFENFLSPSKGAPNANGIHLPEKITRLNRLAPPPPPSLIDLISGLISGLIGGLIGLIIGLIGGLISLISLICGLISQIGGLIGLIGGPLVLLTLCLFSLCPFDP